MFGDAATDRLRLERWDHATHARPLAALNADPEVTRYVGHGYATEGAIPCSIS